MSALFFGPRRRCERLGLKGPRAAQWLDAQGVALPVGPNTWTRGARPDSGDGLLVVRLGMSEFFLEAQRGDESPRALMPVLATPPNGVYPVLREDAAFLLSGDGTLDVLAQVCNVNFTAYAAAAHSVVLTMMVGVAVLIVPNLERGSEHHRIWCDPTFGYYLDETLGQIVAECGGIHTGEAL